MSKYIPSVGFIVQVAVAVVIIFAVASLAGFGGAILNPVGFVTGMFGKKAPAA